MIAKKHSLLLRNIIWAIIIFILCAMPASKVPSPGFHIPHLDKVVHFGMFFIMAIFLCSELHYQTRLRSRLIYLLTILFCAVYGGVIEVLQELYFQRSGDGWDWLADVLGAVAGCMAFPLLRTWKNRLFKKNT